MSQTKGYLVFLSHEVTKSVSTPSEWVATTLHLPELIHTIGWREAL